MALSLALSPFHSPTLGNNHMTLVPRISCMVSTYTQNWSIPQDLTANDHTIRYGNYTDEFSVERGRQLKTIRHALSLAIDDPLEGLMLVDGIQRLSIDYHFREEIEALLKRQHITMDTYLHTNQENLYGCSICFRLLRQEGYYVPADIFDNFKDKEGKFKNSLGKDINGLTELYEASQLILKGEDTLQEARDFSSQLLNGWIKGLDSSRAHFVKHALEYPYHRSLASFTAKKYIRYFRGRNKWERNLKELAKIEFQMVQSTHREELLEFSRWWKDLGLVKDLTFVRDQPLKWYAWPMAMLADPILSMQRIELTKAMSLIYVIDDIFDVRGTLEDLILFTEVVNRWDINATDQLPDYMKICFKALYATTNEIGHKVSNEHGWNVVASLKNAWASLCDAFLVEAKWFASGYIPKTEEYLKNGIVSSSVHVMLLHIFFLLGLTHPADDISGIISSVATIFRLWDDLGSAEDENQDGNDGSYIECYMKEHEREGYSKEFAQQHVIDMISDAWKCLNRECLTLRKKNLPSFTNASLNLARMVPLMYDYDENHHLPVLEEYVKSMLY